MAEAVGKLFRSTFYFSESTFDGVPVSVSDVSKSEAKSMEGSMEPGASIDWERGIVDLMFLAKFVEEHPDADGSSRRKELDVKEVVRLRIDGGEQPKLFVIDSNHRFIDCDVIG